MKSELNERKCLPRCHVEFDGWVDTCSKRRENIMFKRIVVNDWNGISGKLISMLGLFTRGFREAREKTPFAYSFQTRRSSRRSIPWYDWIAAMSVHRETQETIEQKNAQRAPFAVTIQSAYRGHMTRKLMQQALIFTE